MNAGVSRSRVKGIYWANSFVDRSCIFCLNFTLSNYESVCVCLCVVFIKGSHSDKDSSSKSREKDASRCKLNHTYTHHT